MEENNDIRKDNLKADNFNSVLLRDIHNSNLPVSTIYYILKDILNEIEMLYHQQADKEYKEFCEVMKQRDAEAAAKAIQEAESNQEEATPAADNNNDKEN